MSKSRRNPVAHVSMWATVLAIPVAIIIGYLSIKANWDVAAVSGALDKPVVSLGLGGIRLKPDIEVTVLFGTRRLGEPQTATIGSVPFTLGNEGSKAVEAASLTFRFPSFLNRKSLQAMTMTAFGSGAAKDIQQSLTSGNAFDYSSYEVKSLDPGMGVTIEEPFYAKETKISSEATLVDAAGRHGTASVTVHYSVKWLLTVSGRNIQPANYPLDVACTRTGSMSELSAFAEAQLISDEIRRFRHALDFVQYLGGLLFRNETKSVFLVFQEFAEHLVDNDKMLLASRSTAEVRRINYSLLSWKQLFN